MLDIVFPLHQDLVALASADSSQAAPRRQSGIYDLLQHPQLEPEPLLLLQRPLSEDGSHGMAHSDIRDTLPVRPAAIPAMQKAIDVLGNPFGHPRRLNIDSFSPADPDIPSWWN